MTRPASLPAALELLARLRDAAPPSTAARLEQVMALIQSLSAEAAFFNAQVIDDTALLEAAPRPSAPEAETSAPVQEPDTATLPDEAVAEDSTAFDVLKGMNDALRAPLVAIRGRAELLQAGTLGQISEEQGQWLDAIQENTERAFGLLEAVQRLIALQQNEVQVDWASFSASELLEEACRHQTAHAAAHGHELLIQLPDTIPAARGDFYQSLVVLSDLIDNAIRYTPEGGHIRLSVDDLGTHVLFSVMDNGIGLHPEDLAVVGSPFWRGTRHPLVRQHTGSGLSLFLARRLLALQGGELIFSGDPGLGSTFSFTLLVSA